MWNFWPASVLTQLTRPGAPVVYATASTTGYMKKRQFCRRNTPEAMLINTPQQSRWDGNITISPPVPMCGITHSKAVDCQAGYETMMSLMMGVLSGANIGVQWCGHPGCIDDHFL